MPPADPPSVDTLLLLVGGNPLPNYLVAATLRPRQVALLCTTDTADVAHRLRRALNGFGLDVVPPEPLPRTDPARAQQVRRDVKDICRQFGVSSVHLDYTGGTKVMAAHARMAFAEEGGVDGRASYLDESARLVRADDGTWDAQVDGSSLDLVLQPQFSPAGC